MVLQGFCSVYWLRGRCCGKAGWPEGIQENRSPMYWMEYGVICSIKRERSLCVPESVTLYDTLQIRLLLRKGMFPHIQTTHQQDLSTVRSGFLPCWLETSLCHRNVPRMPLNNLSPSHSFHQMGHFMLSNQSLASGMRSADKTGSYSWKLTNFV